ncbi:PucR family transcriptional regulator ligand-binding domain-containing protein [Metallumcola ferriviriculae]|uniref:PucR family transcriptional regulator ligand-binding domain-containing protein n=1 Tax=Metallumcola ferriviriculae TaxID=3039180 RepID=A0AAU0UVH6_9FIRM|nr:PucR family transcriptional regulator ligand-binding domain-containing protein [Desulfitibacteraceae bacterium MK1]
MTFQVSDALKMEAFKDAILLSGNKGLQKKIRWVNILELLDDISLVRPGELLITTAFGLAQDKELQEKLIPTLAGKKISCLAIQTGYYLQEVPKRLIIDAERFSIPLIQLPQGMSFSHATTDLLTRIVNRQFGLLEYRERVRRQLLQTILDNGDFSSLVKVLRQHLGKYPIRILDSTFNALASSRVEPALLSTKNLTKELDQLVQQGYLDNAETDHSLMQIKAVDNLIPAQRLMPILASGNQVLGYISVLNLPAKLSYEQSTVLDQSSTVCALLFLRQIAVKETENRLQGDFLDDLLAGNFLSTDQVEKRAAFLGYNLAQYGMILLANIDDFSGYIHGKNETDIHGLKNNLLYQVNCAIGNHTNHSFITRLRSDSIIVLVLAPEADNNEWQNRLAQTIRARVNQQFPNLSLSIGIGRFYHSVTDFRKSYSEAEKSLHIARKLYQTDAIASFDQLGFYRLLLENGTNELDNFYRETLGALISYDQEKGTELEKTLAVYLEQNRNAQAAAEELFIHRHTLRYRLGRIEEIAGIGLDNAENVFNLQVGLKLRKILR